MTSNRASASMNLIKEDFNNESEKHANICCTPDVSPADLMETGEELVKPKPMLSPAKTSPVGGGGKTETPAPGPKKKNTKCR